jgi:hypothetical protein
VKRSVVDCHRFGLQGVAGGGRARSDQADDAMSSPPPTPTATLRSRPWAHTPTLAALAAALVLRPLAYTVIDPVPFTGPLDGSAGRAPWWWFHAWILAWQWLPFLLAWWALARSGRAWSEYGVDWSWFGRHRWPLIVGAVLLVAVAFVAPRYWYGAGVPSSSQTFGLLPVTATERLFFLVAALSAGVCEETCYRGLPLRGVATSAVVACGWLPVTTVSFVFVHGWFGVEHLGLYATTGLLFGLAFLALGRRRLQWLMTVHALVDAACIAAP